MASSAHLWQLNSNVTQDFCKDSRFFPILLDQCAWLRYNHKTFQVLCHRYATFIWFPKFKCPKTNSSADPFKLIYNFGGGFQFEFEWLELAINCSKWAISLQVEIRSLKAHGYWGIDKKRLRCNKKEAGGQGNTKIKQN